MPSTCPAIARTSQSGQSVGRAHSSGVRSASSSTIFAGLGLCEALRLAARVIGADVADGDHHAGTAAAANPGTIRVGQRPQRSGAVAREGRAVHEGQRARLEVGQRPAALGPSTRSGKCAPKRSSAASAGSTMLTVVDEGRAVAGAG